MADIQGYIEQSSPQAAHTLRRSIETGVERLPHMPYVFRLGRVAGTREHVVHPNYIVVYPMTFSAIVIDRVLHVRQAYA